MNWCVYFFKYFLGEFKKIEESDESQRKHRLQVFLATEDARDVKKSGRCANNNNTRDVKDASSCFITCCSWFSSPLDDLEAKLEKARKCYVLSDLKHNLKSIIVSLSYNCHAL